MTAQIVTTILLLRRSFSIAGIWSRVTHFVLLPLGTGIATALVLRYALRDALFGHVPHWWHVGGLYCLAGWHHFRRCRHRLAGWSARRRMLAGFACHRQSLLTCEGHVTMCGIAGILNIRGNPVEPAQISRLTNLLAHRGPFGEGSWFSANRNLAFGHRRLAIIDPGEGGFQPMVSADGRHVIVFNGEIYNFLELRRELEAQGAIFRSQSDTEVILAAWRVWQEGMLSRFNGMWALAIFDTQTEDLFLARDRFGIKPLLYSWSPESFVFASEQRALVRSGLINTALDVDVARRLLLDAFGIEGSERTLCREVRRLQGGHCMWLRQGRLEIRRWWRTADHLPEVPATEGERVERFRELFQDAVALRMRSDVPIGTCLSGGFDSSAVICTMAAHEKAGMGPRETVHPGATPSLPLFPAQ